MVGLVDEEDRENKMRPWVLGSRPGPEQIKRTFWPGVKHDPDDTEDKDWANSEPDPNAP